MKRQGNLVSAVMTNFDIAREATETAYTSSGSAMRELGNYQQGIEYSMDRFKASFQEFSNTALSSDLVKGVVDSGNGLMNLLTALTDNVGILPTIAGIFGGRYLTKTGQGKRRSFNAPLCKAA